MNKTRLKKYARLIAECGVNVQRGQEVYITAELVFCISVHTDIDNDRSVLYHISGNEICLTYCTD